MSLTSEKATQETAPKKSTVLLLDDDANTLLVLRTIIESTVEKVIECEDEECVIRWCQELEARIDLLVADVVLQAGNGPAVVRKVKPLQPLMRLLFISGFSMKELQKRGLLTCEEMAPGNIEFLQKPFSQIQFLTTVEKLLAS